MNTTVPGAKQQTFSFAKPDADDLAYLAINLEALKDNWKYLRDLSGSADCGAVVKAQAYGLDIKPVVTSLYTAGCRHFFVATIKEAIELRKLYKDVQVFALNTYLPKNCHLYQKWNVTPVLNDLKQVRVWNDFCAENKIQPAALHIDTGMNRAGLTEQETAQFLSERATYQHLELSLILSHLACSDSPTHPLNGLQLQRFNSLTSSFEGIALSLSNSDAVMVFRSDYHFDLTRPGIAIFGCQRIDGMTINLKPVVGAYARILTIRTLPKGSPVSYGATQVTTRKTITATAAIGYADGFHRASSQSGIALRCDGSTGGYGFVSGIKIPILGRITMDMTVFDITDVEPDSVTSGDFIELFGDNISVDEAAFNAGTIGYEFLTSLGTRYKRIYSDY